MFNLEEEVKKWKKELRKIQSFEEGYIRELETHFRDTFEEGKEKGMNDQDALQYAIDDVGETEKLGEEYYKTDTIKSSGRPPWKSHPFLPDLFYNYLKIAVRNFKKNKTFFSINVMGISIGLAFFILLSLFVDYHFGFNTFHENTDEIYSLIQVNKSGNQTDEHSAFIPAPVLPNLVEETEDIEEGSRLIISPNTTIKYKEKVLLQSGIKYVDENFFDFFSFKLISGEKSEVLKEPNAVVLTKSTAEKYFDNEDPVGKFLQFKDGKNYKVTGIAENVPNNSGIKFNVLLSINSISWENDWALTGAAFFRKNNSSSIEQITNSFPQFISKYYDSENAPVRFYTVALADIYTETNNVDVLWYQTDAGALYMLLGIGIALLLIMSINFINLSTARSMTRTKEVGLRKVIGAKQSQLVVQYLSEAVVLTLIAFPIALILTHFLSPIFNYLMSSGAIIVELSIWENPNLLFKMFLVTCLVGFLSGIYPAFYISRFNPVKIFQKKDDSKKSKGILRKVLVVSQFSFAIFLVALSIVIYGQYEFLYNLDLGYSRENIKTIRLSNNELEAGIDNIKNKLMQHPMIENVSASAYVPVFWHSSSQVSIEGSGDEKSWYMNTYPVDYGFAETVELKLVSGRTHSINYSDSTGFVINKAAASQLPWENPLGKRLTFNGRMGEIIGVVEDFHFKNLHYKILPSVIYLDMEQRNYLLVKLSAKENPEILNFLEETWKELLPNEPFIHSSLDDYFSIAYSPLENYSMVTGMISIVAILFSCLGILGLASFTIQRKLKEISIRKVLGSSNNEIVALLVKGFIYQIGLANLIALPLVYISSKMFVEYGWSYQRDLDISIFIFSGMLTIMSAIGAIIYQIVRASRINPAILLKYE